MIDKSKFLEKKSENIMVKKVVSYVSLGIVAVVLVAMGILAFDMIKLIRETNQNQISTDNGELLTLLWYKGMLVIAAAPGIISSVICFKVTESKPIKIISGVLLGLFIVVFAGAGITMSN